MRQLSLCSARLLDSLLRYIWLSRFSRGSAWLGPGRLRPSSDIRHVVVPFGSGQLSSSKFPQIQSRRQACARSPGPFLASARRHDGVPPPSPILREMSLEIQLLLLPVAELTRLRLLTKVLPKTLAVLVSFSLRQRRLYAAITIVCGAAIMAA